MVRPAADRATAGGLVGSAGGSCGGLWEGVWSGGNSCGGRCGSTGGESGTSGSDGSSGFGFGAVGATIDEAVPLSASRYISFCIQRDSRVRYAIHRRKVFCGAHRHIAGSNPERRPRATQEPMADLLIALRLRDAFPDAVAL